MRILLFGKNGQVGWALQRALAPLGDVTSLGREDKSPGRERGAVDAGLLRGDLADLEGIAHSIRTLCPDVIVNAAAFTAVDAAESALEEAYAINALAPQRMAEIAREIGALLVHYSTDYVFNGSGRSPWQESDTVDPINAYGASKADGECRIRDSGARHLILRTQWVYASRGRNFIKTMLRLAQERDALSVIDDQIGAPTGADLIADVTAHLVRACQADDGRAHNGTYHLAARGETSWHGYAQRVIETARAAGLPIRTPRQAISAVPTRAFPTPARRPHNSRLSTARLESDFGLRLPEWQAGVDHTLTEILEPMLAAEHDQ